MSDPGQPPPGGWPPIQAGAGSGSLPETTPSGPSKADDAGSVPAQSPWTPPAGQAPPPPYTPPPPAPGGVPSGGAGAAGGSTGPAGSAKRIKPASVSGRRPPSVAILGGLGLLGLLITIAILALLTNRVLSGTSDADVPIDPARTIPSTIVIDDAPGTETPPGADQGDSGGGGLPAGGNANPAACQTTRATLEVAAQAYELMNGAPPVDQQALVDSGVLVEPSPDFELTSGPGGVQITGVGACEGQ